MVISKDSGKIQATKFIWIQSYTKPFGDSMAIDGDLVRSIKERVSYGPTNCSVSLPLELPREILQIRRENLIALHCAVYQDIWSFCERIFDQSIFQAPRHE